MDAPVQSSPPRRWHQRRLLRYPAALLVAFVGAYFVWDLLFMPADLRRLQGTWKVVRALRNGEPEETDQLPFHRFVITSRRVEVVSGDKVMSHPFYIVPERREFCVYEAEETKLLGITVRLPIWLKRSPAFETMRYEFGENLVLSTLRDEGQPQSEIHLERVE